LSIPLNRRIALNLVGGYPVASSSDGLETDKYFYGANFDLGTFLNHWNFNTYFIQQEANGVTDRQAIGGEIRFFSSRGSFFTLVDYDIHHNELNTVLTNGSYIFPDSTTINLVADYRKSPILTTSNALIGQTVDNLDDLRKFYSDSEIKQLAEDRTATSKNVTLSITRPLTAKVQIAGDVTWAKLDGTEASGEVAAFEGTDDEFYYSLQFIGTSLVREGDLATLGLRYADTTLYDTYSGALDTRYPIADGWRLNPGMVVDYRDHKELDQDQWQLRPSLRVEYRPRRNFRLEVEGGYEWRTDRFEDSEEDSHGYYISAGYRWDF
jgi:hypothetical protein